jgi:hypothetical protein
MMVDLYEHFAAPLAEETMFAWHNMLLSGERSIKTIWRLPNPRRDHGQFSH